MSRVSFYRFSWLTTAIKCRDHLDCENVLLSGYTVDGTFQQYVVRSSVPLLLSMLRVLPQVSNVTCVTPIPEGLDSAAAASLLCAVSLIPHYFISILIYTYIDRA
jgi:D-arabinose 1-dehydrogenase-like Zn-dependent alcohol dehydrogenase